MALKARLVLYCLLGGLPMCLGALKGDHFGWWWLTGVVLTASFLPVVLYGPRSAAARSAVIASVLVIVTSFCTWTEGVIFVPRSSQHAVSDLVGSILISMILAMVLAGLAWVLSLTGSSSDSAVKFRAGGTAALLIVVCGLAYALYYVVFGAITYQFFTKGYYPEAASIVQRLGLWFWVIQIGRGALMTLALFPLICTLRVPRWQAAIAVGLLAWVVGGLAPLVIPNGWMGAKQRAIHMVEILTQNASLGVTAVMLLRPEAAHPERFAPSQMAA